MDGGGGRTGGGSALVTKEISTSHEDRGKREKRAQSERETEGSPDGCCGMSGSGSRDSFVGKP